MKLYMTKKPVPLVDVRCDECGGYTATVFYPVYTGPDGRTYCANCNHWFKCADCGDLTDNDNLNNAPDGAELCGPCYNRNYSSCEDCREVFRDNDLREIDGRYVCDECFHNYGTWDIPDWRGRSEYDKVGSSREFGVEVETNACDNHTELNGRDGWGCHHDASVNGEEFVSSILYGNEGLNVINNLSAFAAANTWEVDRNCGLHIHLDASNETDVSLLATAAAYLSTYSVWKEFVDSDRIANGYCGRSAADIYELGHYDSFDRFASLQTRYEWVNFAAYHKHRTIEVRLHEGSIDSKAINNWIRAHTTFMDWAVKQSYAGIVKWHEELDTTGKFHAICKIWTDAGCDDLIAYYAYKGNFDLPEVKGSIGFDTKLREVALIGATRGIR